MVTKEQRNKERAGGKGQTSFPKIAIMLVAALMLTLCIAVPLANINNEDNIIAGDHRAPVLGEIEIHTYQELQSITDFTADDILMADIMCPSGENFRPIGYDIDNTTVTAFTGSFDGNGYVIDGMNVDSYDGTNYYQYAGLFALLDEYAKISNVGLINNSVTSIQSTDNAYAGGIAASIIYTSLNAEIANCYNEGNISATSSLLAYAGGIIGFDDGFTAFTDCYNTGDVSATTLSTSIEVAYAGGIAGRSTGTITDHCYNEGNISASSPSSSFSSSGAYAGGIKGSVSGIITVATTITDCYNTGDVSATSPSPTGVTVNTCAGGIVGFAFGSLTFTITDCYNTGDVSASSSSYVYTGGIAGKIDGTITNCYNTGDVSTLSLSTGSSNDVCAGGIAGSFSGTIADCYNEGDVSTESNDNRVCAGGIAGYPGSGKITGCYNTGDISAKSDSFARAGGIAGEISGTNVEITGCYNTGDISVTATLAYTGGITGGIVGTNAVIANCYNTGDVSAKSDNFVYAGGIAGASGDDLEITNCYNRGDVSASSSSSNVCAGGIAGSVSGTSSITNCYNTGLITAAAPTMASGPIAGRNAATVTECYWLDTLGFSGGLPIEDMTGANAVINMTGLSSSDWYASGEMKNYDEDHFTVYFPQLSVFSNSSDVKVRADSEISASSLMKKIDVHITQSGTYEYIVGDRLSALVPVEEAPVGIPGTFVWKNGNDVVALIDTTKPMVFTPQNLYYKTVTFDVTISVIEGYDVPVIVPSGTYEYIEGEMLSARTITETYPSGFPGTFTWLDGGHVTVISDTTADIVFTPRDTRYKVVTINVPITVVTNVPVITQTGTYSYIVGEKVSDRVPAETSPAGISGTFAWKNGNEVLTTLGPDTKVMVFTAYDFRYSTCEFDVTVSVEEGLAVPTITSSTTYYYVQGESLSARVPTETAPAGIPGTFAWKNGNYTVTTIDTTAKMVFTANDFRYSTYEFDVTISVEDGLPVPSITQTGTYEYVKGEKLHANVPSEIAPAGIPGTFIWQNANEVVKLGDTSKPMVFIPYDARYSPVTFSVTIKVIGGLSVPTISQTGVYSYVQGEKVSANIPSEVAPAGVPGVFSWYNGNEIVTTADTTKRMVFMPNDERYTPITFNVTITVTGGLPVPTITQTGVYSYVQGEKLHANVPTEVAPAGIPGTFAWKNGNYTVTTTDTTAVMVFMPNDFRYSPVSFNVALTVSEAPDSDDVMLMVLIGCLISGVIGAVIAVVVGVIVRKH